MHTTGLAAEPIERLYEGGLGDALAEARRRTLAIYAHLDLESLRVPCIPTVNPPLWELAHVAWFQEFWCLRGGNATAASMLERSDALFNSSTVPHDSRWHLDYPPASDLFGYIGDTLDRTLEALARTADEERYFFHLALLHEDMHGEALVMTLQTLGLPAPRVGASEPSRSAIPAARDVRFDGGEFIQGTRRAPFSFDNEMQAHAVKVAPFAIATRCVTQGEFAAYVEDTSAPAPGYWRREGSSWLARRFDRWQAIEPDEPMVHVELPEALAYCRWAGRRLPTEREWEFAARNGGVEDRYTRGDLTPGGVWEWTSSAFEPYPGFSPGPYRDYSEPWFHSHFVLRGGSFVTRSRIAHNRFRNFYLPERADVFAGFRTCALEAR